ncbi:MAG: HEAT repeat domain-containing protein [Actinomycetota bacterium]
MLAELTHKAPSRRWEAAEALGRLGVTESRLPLERALSDSHYRVRRHAALTLGQLGDAAAIEALLTHIRDPHPVARRAVVEALGKLGAVQAQEALCEALRDPEPRVRGAAAVALGRVGGADTVRPLVDALRDSDDLVCRWAARALGDFARREPRVALRVALPELKRRLVWWSFEHKEPYRLALRRIEEATEARKNAPLPSTAPPGSGAALPIPGGPPDVD